MSDDPLGPTGNTADACQYCGRAHHALAACDSYALKREILRLRVEDQRLRGEIDHLMRFKEWSADKDYLQFLRDEEVRDE